MTKQEFTQWICEKLSAILQFEVQNDMAEYILSMQSEQDLDEYCRSLLDIKSPVHKQFLLDLKKRYKLFNQKPTSSVLITRLPQQNTKTQENEEKIDTDKKQKKNASKSKNKKYVNMYSDEGLNRQEVFLKGRHKCNCQASKHGLISNCLSCGRIVCKQEGSGPCVVCGELVCSNEEKLLLNCNNNKSKELYNRLIEQSVNVNADNKALEHRNKLLEFDRTSAKRTTVIDDQMDYYSVNSGWLSSKQREQMHQKEEERQEKKHGSRKTKKITIDFAGRQVYEEDKESDDDNNISSINDSEETQPVIINDHLNNPLIKMDLKFNDDAIKKIKKHSVYFNNPLGQHDQGFNRVQDAELMLMTDPGLCLSMHQPYASLLLLNIKNNEGRTWFTPHRGRLWIASTAKKPSQEDINEVETFYKRLKGDITFPKKYPTGCLMGCVNIVDCLSHEEYIEQFPQGENDSPFIFICENPIMMSNHFPIKGQHKIFKLDKKIHNAAQKCLMKEIS
ncbi:activating signal cointegrator 1 isoform X2 [Sipha flava]|uniref:Activating signal cointegrator 1 isoform X2 n=3 Tax=Sipha flava TaxID=143950 RepID=A0A8B8FV13_9HEMI|nr:activating signal cointegrator 1 isoform X2 [Sipha flava]